VVRTRLSWSVRALARMPFARPTLFRVIAAGVLLAVAAGVASAAAEHALRLAGPQGTLTVDERGIGLAPTSPACPPIQAAGGPWWAILVQKDVPPPIADEPRVLTNVGQTVTYEMLAGGIRLTYPTLVDQGTTWPISLTLTIQPQGAAFEVTAAIQNRQPGWIVCGFTGPVLSGIQANLTDHPALLPDGFGRRVQRVPSPAAKTPAPWRQAGQRFEIEVPYPSRQGTMQWCALAGAQGGFYLGCHDAQHAAKTFVLRYDPAAKHLGLAVKYQGFCPAGRDWNLPPLVLLSYDGSWHVAAQHYRAWVDAATPLRPAPAWLRDASGWLLCILKQQNGEVLWDYPALASLAEVADRRGLDILGLFGWAHGGHDHLYPDYNPDPKLGGGEALRRGLQEVHRRGKRAIIYANGQLQEIDTPFWNSQGKDLAVILRTGQPHQETWHKFRNAPAYHFGFGCLASQGWYDRMLSLALQAQQLGADGILYDQLGNTRAMACYAPNHGHPVPSMVYAVDRVSMLRRIAEHMQKIDPNFIIMTEGLHDSVLNSIGLFHGCVLGVFSTAPAELIAAPRAVAPAFPELFRYTYPEVMSTIRVPTPMLTRAQVNHACLLGFRYEIESRYAPDVRYLKEDRVPEAQEYEQVISKPDIAAMQATPPQQATRYLAQVIAFQRAHRDVLWHGRFTDDEGFTLQGPAGLLAKSYVAGRQRGILVWNPTAEPATFALEVPHSKLLSAAEPEKATSEPFSPLGPQSLRLLLYQQTP